MTVLLVVAAGLLCLGGLLGASWTTQAMSSISRRHATERKHLNDSWRELDAARRTRGTGYCPRCDNRTTDTSWVLVVDHDDEEDDGT